MKHGHLRISRSINVSLSIFLIAICVSALGPGIASVSAQSADPLTTVLEQVGMTPDDLTFDYADMSNYGGDEFVLPLFRTFHRHPLRIPYYVDFHANWLLGNWRNTSGVIGFCSQRIAEGSRRGLIGDPLEKYQAAADTLTLDALLDTLATVADWDSPVRLSETQIRQWQSLPGTVRLAAKAILYAAADAY